MHMRLVQAAIRALHVIFKICNVNLEACAHQSDDRALQLLHNIHNHYIISELCIT